MVSQTLLNIPLLLFDYIDNNISLLKDPRLITIGGV